MTKYEIVKKNKPFPNSQKFCTTGNITNNNLYT